MPNPSHIVDPVVMLVREKELLMADHLRRSTACKGRWTGIAISGGGIRSATFALGAVQALANADLLAKFDYMSSVSGGSYLACSLQWWWSSTGRPDGTGRPGFGTTRADFPYGLGVQSPPGLAEDRPDQAGNLWFLSHHARYLAPGRGISLMSGLAVVMRTVLISLLVWVPLLVTLFVTVARLDQQIISPTAEWLLPSLGEAQQPAFLSLKGCWTQVAQSDCAFNLRVPYVLGLLAFPAWAFGFAAFSIVLGLQSRATASGGKRRLFSIVTSLIAVALSFSFAVSLTTTFRAVTTDTVLATLLIALFGFSTLVNLIAEITTDQRTARSYRLRRAFEVVFAATLAPAAVGLLVGIVPVVEKAIIDLNTHDVVTGTSGRGALGSALAVASLLGGVVSSLYGYYSLARQASPGLAAKLFSALAAFIFLYVLMLLCYGVGVVVFEALYNGDSRLIGQLANSIHETSSALREQITALVVLIVCPAVLLAVLADVNQVGLHRFYRDRLMETMMPDRLAVDRKKIARSAVADQLTIADQAAPLAGDASTGPFPYSIVNAIAILSDDEDERVASRGGDNFILSPLFVGCSATGWSETRTYMQSTGPLTLATAMAASGAAVNAGTGYVGTGVTRGRLLSMAMSVLNMRLGVWIPNPRLPRLRARVPTFVWPMLKQGILGRGHKSTAAFVELADGGNFDNLGLYELIRRKLDLIVVIDGEADSTMALPGFVSVVRRVYDDFQTRIEFAPGDGPDRFVGLAQEELFPSTAKFARSPFLVAKIRYPNEARLGTLIYVKLTGLKQVDFTTLGYWAANAAFPYEPTINQFFTVAQFEAYRDLGFRAVSETISGLDLTRNFEDAAAMVRTYRADW